MRYPGIKWSKWHIILSFLSRFFRNCRCIFQLLKFPLLEFHEMSRQIFEELKVTHLIWHPIHIVFLRSTNCFPIYNLCIFRSSSKSPKKYGPPPLTITHPIIWSILHANLIYKIDWSHPKIVHMNDIETMKYHVHILLLNFTVDFLPGGGPFDILSHRWNNVHSIFLSILYTSIYVHVVLPFITAASTYSLALSCFSWYSFPAE